MLKNYFKIAFRNLTKNKLHSGINIFGLAIGFMVAILSILFVKSEYEADRWLPQSDQIYRAYRNWGQGAGGWVAMPGPYAQTLVDNIPGVEKATRLADQENMLFTYGDKSLYVPSTAFVDSSFFHVFDFPFAEGDIKTALNHQSGLVISKEIAQRFFGETNPIGQILKVNGEEEVQVTGVLKDTKEKSHLQYDAYARMDETYTGQWLNFSFATYILKSPKASIDNIEAKTFAHIKPIIIDAWKENNEYFDPSNMANWKFQPFTDIYLYSNGLGFSSQKYGNIRSLKIFGLIAFIVLFIATINYMNLSTAKASGRAKEVGMRKVAGAGRWQLIGQFLAESIVQSMIALSIALVLAEFLLPVFNQITDRNLTFFDGNWIILILPLVVVGIVIGFLAGTYPAFILSAFEPIKVLKGGILKNNTGQIFRKFLVVTQFSISVILIIVMLFIFKQVNYMQNQELGFNGAQVVNISVNNYESSKMFLNRKNSFLNIPGVISATGSNQLPGNISGGMSFNIEGIEEMQGAPMVLVSPDYDKTIGLELEEGRFFLDEYPNDTANTIVVNEAFVARYGLEDPLKARLKLFGQTEYSNIVGVVKDFHASGLQNSIPPLFFVYRPNWGFDYISLKIASTNIPETLSAIEKKWGKIEPLHPIRFSFLDEDFARQYAEQENFGQTMMYATGLAIFIAILGLFGLASFMAEQRTKEIGVRKVLGASVLNLINLLVKDFVKLILIAGLIAVPFGYWLVSKWLEDFAYTTSINAMPFVLAVVGALVLAILTVSYQSIRVSSGNPVEALKME